MSYIRYNANPHKDLYLHIIGEHDGVKQTDGVVLEMPNEHTSQVFDIQYCDMGVREWSIEELRQRYQGKTVQWVKGADK